MMANQQTEDEPQDEQEDDGPRQREPAWRVFAAEFNDATHETRGEGERAPSYVITPLGGRVNRLLAVGVLTSNEPAGEDGSMRRAQITDPTGVFHVYAGRYQPEALEVLENLEAPSIVAVVGKARTYSPEEGTVYTSIRPETIHPVTSAERDTWILEAAEQTADRVDALNAAYGIEDRLTQATLEDAGVPARLHEGILEALDAYGQVDLASYLSLVSDALGYLLPDPPEPQIVRAGQGDPSPEPEAADEEEPDEPVEPDEPPQGQDEEGEDAEGHPDPEGAVFDLVEAIDEGDGAPWEEIVDRAGEAGLTEEEVEEAMNALMERGRVFEPVLGKLKPT